MFDHACYGLEVGVFETKDKVTAKTTSSNINCFLRCTKIGL